MYVFGQIFANMVVGYLANIEEICTNMEITLQIYMFGHQIFANTVLWLAFVWTIFRALTSHALLCACGAQLGEDLIQHQSKT